jgi:hypothetical protein
MGPRDRCDSCSIFNYTHQPLWIPYSIRVQLPLLREPGSLISAWDSRESITMRTLMVALKKKTPPVPCIKALLVNPGKTLITSSHPLLALISHNNPPRSTAMRVTSYISFFFLLGTIALATPVRRLYYMVLMLSIHAQRRRTEFTPSCGLQSKGGEHTNDLNLVSFWRRASLVF